MVVDNNITIDHTVHTAGYMNLSGFLGIADYADAEVHHCGGNSVTLSAAMAGMPTADADGNYRMNNDALLMEGYLCHVCLPEPCSNGGVCSHIPWGFTCDCSGTGYGGDTCSTPVPLEPCSRAFGRQAAAQVVATDAHGLASPRDLQFHPLNPDELWVANNDTDSLTIIDTVAGTAVTRKDRAPYHYMERISSLAFDSRGYFATCQESDNTYDDMMIANHFMGPTLFHSAESDLVNQLGEPECNTEDPDTTCFFTHWDMLHESPLCMGIAHDPEDRTPFGNVYWAFDGLNSSLIRYDFSEPHGPGSLDHSIAAIRRYPEIELTRVPGIPGHLMMDPTERVLYIADTGGGRILRMNPDSGHFIRNAKREFPIYSSIAETFEYSIYGCAEWEVFVDGLDEPSGLEISEGLVYVSEHGTGKVLAFDRVTRQQIDSVQTDADSLLGIALDGHGNLWYSDAARSEVSKLVVEETCEEGSIPDHAVDIVVGGPAGWRVQDYTEVTAVVGQNLAFEFEAFHDVYLMPDQAAFDACDFTSATRLANSVDSPYTYLVDSAGTFYFSDSVGMHCQGGQKLAVTVEEARMVWPERECTMVVDNNITIDHTVHTAGYMNLSGFLGIADYADAEVHHCGGNSVTLSAAMAGMPTADADGNYRMNNDALLMEGYLCHVCLPEPCSNGGVCSHIPWGFTCDCSGTGYGGDTCSTPVPLEPCARAFGRQAVAQVVATDAHGLASPRDLQFHPLNPDELWVANNDTDSLTIIDTVAGTAVTRKDRAPYHYMERISSLAFDSRGYFATCQESDNTYDDMMIANHFMGPTLFHSAESDLVNQLGEPECNTEDPDTTCFFTHWDMLHESPLCMGIAHDPEDRTPFGNVYWAFDGLNSSLIRYDFSEPHGPGS